MYHKNKECILIVDDDENVCKSLALIFGKKGYETKTAFTGREALKLAKRKFFTRSDYSLILSSFSAITVAIFYIIRY